MYSISARIGGTGLDLDCHEAIRATWNEGILARAVAYDNRQVDVPNFVIRSLRWHPVRLLSFLDSRYYYGAKKQYLDWICARQVATGEFDLVHSWSGDCLRTFREARRRGIPTVLEIPTWHRNKGKQKPAVTQSERERSRLPMPRRWLEQLPPTRQHVMEEYDLADLILVLSQKAAETFLAAGIEEERLFPLPRGTDILRFTPGRKPDHFAAIFVGSLSKRKGVDLLLRTWHGLALKNATLTLLGTVQKEIEPVLRQYAGENVRVLGHVPNTEDYLAASSVHIFPSTCEGSAKVTYDAAASGLAQITTREAGDVVVDGVNGLVIPCGNPEALADAITKVYHQRDLLTTMGRAARERVEQNFTWEHYHQRLMSAYALAFQRRKANR